MLSHGLVRVSDSDPFAGNTADHVSTQPGTNYPGSQVEPYVVANPARANNLAGIWQQDRWDNGGARGLVVGVSNDHGASWKPVVLPGVALTSGGIYARATDPWLSFATDGTLYATSLSEDVDPALPFGDSRTAILVSRSTDGGLTWGTPTTLIDDPNPFVVNDKETVTADPTDPKKAYVVWDRPSIDPGTGAFQGPAYFSRTTDGGKTWEPARAIYTPPVGSTTNGNQVVVLPDGTLVDSFAEGSATTGGRFAVIRSTDHGVTWTAPISLGLNGFQPGVTDPDTGQPVRSSQNLTSIAVDPGSGALYVVTGTIVSLPDFTPYPGINLFVSGDGGLTWSGPTRINKTPTNVPVADQQAFEPSVTVAGDGTVAVTYDDFRNNTPAPGAATDAWAVFARPGAPRSSPGGLSNPANWGGEVRLTDQSFDMEQAPNVGGSFLGDYQGLTASGNQFLSFFAIAGSDGTSTSGVYSRWFHVEGNDPKSQETRLPSDALGRKGVFLTSSTGAPLFVQVSDGDAVRDLFSTPDLIASRKRWPLMR